MNIAALNVKIGADIADFNKGIDAVVNKFKQVEQQFSGIASVGQGMQSVGRSLTVGLTLPIVALGAASIKSFGDIQALKLGLEAVTGSSAEAAKQVNRLRQVAKLPGLGLAEAVKGSINLQTIGFSAEKAERSMKAFGNAVATVGKGKAEFERAIYGLQQLSNTEFPLGEDLNILRDAIPQITPLLKEAFGTARTEELQKLGITSEQVVNTILEGLEKLPPVAGGINNAFENLGDSIKNSLGTIGEDLNRAFNVEGVLNKVADFVERATNAFTKLSPAVKNTIYVVAGLAAAIGPLLVIFGSILTALPLMAAGFVTLKASVLPAIAAFATAALPIIAVIAAVAALSAAIYGIVKAADLFKIAFKRAFLEVKGYVNDAILSMFESIQSFGDKFDIDLGFKKAIQEARNFQNEISQTLAITPNVSFKDAEDKMRQSVIDAFTSVKEEVYSAMVKAEETVKEGVTNINNGLKGIGSGTITVPVKIAPIGLEAAQMQPINIDSTGLQALVAVSDALEKAKEKSLAFGGSFDLVGEKTRILQTAISTLIDQGFTAGTGALEAMKLKMKEVQTEMDALGNKAIDVGQIFKANLTNAIAGFAETLGQSFTNGGNFFDGILAVVADFVGSFGKMLIAAGVASTAFKESLMTNPYAAIAAGAALVAISAAIKGHLNAGPGGAPSTAGGGGGGGSSFSAGYNPNINNKVNEYREIEISGQLTAKGGDLVYVFNEATKREGRVGG